MNGKMPDMSANVSAACEAGGAAKLRMTCFSRSLGGRGPMDGRSLGWSVTCVWELYDKGGKVTERVEDERKASGSKAGQRGH
jgi:hypothetical protein